MFEHGVLIFCFHLIKSSVRKAVRVLGDIYATLFASDKLFTVLQKWPNKRKCAGQIYMPGQLIVTLTCQLLGTLGATTKCSSYIVNFTPRTLKTTQTSQTGLVHMEETTDLTFLGGTPALNRQSYTHQLRCTSAIHWFGQKPPQESVQSVAFKLLKFSKQIFKMPYQTTLNTRIRVRLHIIGPAAVKEEQSCHPIQAWW